MRHSDQLAATGARAPDFDHMRWLEEFDVLGETGWRGKSVLDLGCGSGFLCAEAARRGAAFVVGVDLKTPDVETNNFQFLSVDLDGEHWAAQLSDATERRFTFDLICAFDILEHLSSPVKFLSGCRSLLSPTGHLVITTPNTASWERWLRGEQWSGATDAQHRILFTPYSLGFLLRRIGFQPKVLRAPIRKLSKLGLPCPDIGAQIFCVASTSSATDGASERT